MGNKLYIELPLPNKKQVIIFLTIILSFFILLGSTLAYSILIKTEGDKQYKKQNYTAALLKYRLAQQWWLPERISFKLRDRDLYYKLNKAEIMAESNNNFLNGVKAFKNKKYIEAEKYLNNLVLKDPHYQESQKILLEIDKLLSPSPTPFPRKEKTTITPVTTDVTTVNTKEENNNTKACLNEYVIISKVEDPISGKNTTNTKSRSSEGGIVETGRTLKVGDTVTLKLYSESTNAEWDCLFSSLNGTFSQYRGWSTDSQCSFTVPDKAKDDPQKKVHITAIARNSKSSCYRFITFDDQAQAIGFQVE